jgi:hypothetical protein
LIAAKRIMPLRGACRLTQLMEIARMLAMVEDHLLIQFREVVKHARCSKGGTL